MLFFSRIHSPQPALAVSKLAVTLLTTGSTSLLLTTDTLIAESSAQTIDTGSTDLLAQAVVNRDAATGSVTVNRNAYTLETGPLLNTSNIPLPAFVPSQTAVGQPIPTLADGTLAPNSVIFGTDLDYIRANFGEAVTNNPNNPFTNGTPNYTFEEDSIIVTTEISLEHAVGDHQYGEGIELRVLDKNNNVVSDAVITDGNGRAISRIFVRGDGVTVGPNGQVLNASEVLRVTYDENQKVALALLNIRENNAAASESGAYFTEEGRLIAEDLQDGGDRDFDDGDYLNFRVGQGRARVEAEETAVEVLTETDTRSLAPEIRREEIVVELPMETIEVSEDSLSESRTYGSVGLADYQQSRLGHATGVRSTADQQTVYSQYSSASQLRAGSDGISAVGQLAPLVNAPTAAPTLLTGEMTFSPFVGDNEAGFVASAGVTQFVTRTHRTATDALGNPITTTAETGERRLLEPTGWFSNRQLVGYVPSSVESLTEDLLTQERLLSVNGIFELPSDRAIVIAPSNPQSVGRGASAYTDNVGGLLIEKSDGSFVFEPQWTKDGYAQDPTVLSSGDAVRLIYALVPQQSGQALQLNRQYLVNADSDAYRIAAGGFRIISADLEPQNFLQESADVYAVEDTLSGFNAETVLFNGRRGEYIEPSGDLAATVDLTVPSEVDARVGNGVYSAPTVGQRPYAKTTRAMGLYVSGTFSGGIGNQRDRFNQQRATRTIETDQIRTQRITNVFETPLTQLALTTREQTTTTIAQGDATFDINTLGLLENAVFNPVTMRTSDPTVRTLGTDTTLQRGEEVLRESVTTESRQIIDTRIVGIEADEVSGTDSYANTTPLRGELAVGSVLNFGNTPWTAAANTLSAEVFFRETILGRGAGSESGWRAALTLHPFGEEQRAAHQYDEAGELVPVYRTEPVKDASGQQRVEKIATVNGEVIEVAVNRFVRDENGDRIPAMVGTGRSRGPGLYLRMQDLWNNRASLSIDGGIQFSF